MFRPYYEDQCDQVVHLGFFNLTNCGGSAVFNIVDRSLPSDKKKLQKNKDLLELNDKVERLEKELRDYKKLLDKTEIQKPTVELKSKNTPDLHQKPEDVIRAFMMTEFMGNRFLDGLIVPEIRSRNHRQY
ncbi:hypothetical protein AB3S75_017380 [Citrus x aurantiifolia]